VAPPAPAAAGRSPNGVASVERALAPGLAAEDPEGARAGLTRFLGLPMLQNRNAVFAWQALTERLAADGVRVARVIEIGTGSGHEGLSVLLQLYCLGQGADFVSYQAGGQPGQPGLVDLFERLRIDRRVRDLGHELVVREIAGEIQGDGVTLVVCDGPDKVREVETFADYLKPGDYILAHDYAPSREVFDRELRGRLWSWCEITDAQIRATIERNGLQPMLPDVLLTAAWGGWVKRAEVTRAARPLGRPIDSVGLYVLSFNAPVQFEQWLASVEAAAPELLGVSTRVLLNNSTDEATFAAYDDLCARYGFSQVRLGNLGINGGRLWCARHFDAETACDAMIYFEDDMLLAADDGRCRNGLSRRVPDLLERASQIVRCEDLDFLKLSFTEVFGDHTQNWTYYNLGQLERAELFPDGPATRVDAVKSYGGVSYLLGEVFYSNWPMLMTRRGNRAMFLGDDDIPRYEQWLMIRALRLARSGALRGGVLLASPIEHRRTVHYEAEQRKEG
jgi:hypothetical protein